MSQLPLRMAIALTALGIPACGARSELFPAPQPIVDAWVPFDAPVDAAVIPKAFLCPPASLDVCGSKFYQPGAPWPAFQRCSSHRGQADAVGPTKPVLLWGTPLGDALLSPPSTAADGTIYVGAPGSMFATYANGYNRWIEYPAEINAGSSTGAVGPDGTIYFATDKVYAFNPDGTIKWSSYELAAPGSGSLYQTLASPGSSVTLGPCGTLFIGSPSGLHVLDNQGNSVWDAPGQSLTPAVDVDGSAYYGTSDGRLVALNPDGSTKWTFTVEGADGGTRLWTQPAPILGPDGTIYFGEGAGFHAIGSDGQELWKYPWAADAGGVPLVGAALASDGTIYVAFPDTTLRALTPDGQLKWTAEIQGYGTSPVIDGNGTIYELGTSGVLAVTPQGKIAWTVVVPGGTSEAGMLAIGGDGTLYVSTQALYAIGNAP